jgi:hypothetical protein
VYRVYKLCVYFCLSVHHASPTSDSCQRLFACLASIMRHNWPILFMALDISTPVSTLHIIMRAVLVTLHGKSVHRVLLMRLCLCTGVPVPTWRLQGSDQAWCYIPGICFSLSLLWKRKYSPCDCTFSFSEKDNLLQAFGKLVSMKGIIASDSSRINLTVVHEGDWYTSLRLHKNDKGVPGTFQEAGNETGSGCAWIRHLMSYIWSPVHTGLVLGEKLLKQGVLSLIVDSVSL